MTHAKDIVEARNLLNKAERSTDPIAKEHLMLRAIELLDSVMEDEPAESDVLVIKNIKLSIVRSVVKQITAMNLNSFDTLELLISIFVRFQNEVSELLERDKVFAEKFRWIVDQYSEEFHSLTKQ